MTRDLPARDAVPCSVCGTPIRLAPRDWNGTDPLYCTEHTVLIGRDPRFVVPDAIKAAEEDLLGMEPLISWCLPSLTDMLGYLLRGTVTYGCAFPKNGKTAFLSNNLAYWDQQGVRTWVMPTESRPKGLITRLAAFRAGVSAEEAMSKRLRVRADHGDESAKRQMVALLREFHEMAESVERDGCNIAIEPAPRLTRRVFQQSCRAAAAAGYELVVVDHVDHVGGDADSHESGYQASEAVQYDALEFAETYDVAVLLMSQLNTSRVSNDPLCRYKRPVTDWVWMKGVKDQIASTMFGIYRPMMRGLDDKLLQAVKAQEAESWRVAQPHTMGVASMLSRLNGARPDRTLTLGYHEGVISERDDADQWADAADQHGIWTGGPSERPRGRAA